MNSPNLLKISIAAQRLPQISRFCSRKVIRKDTTTAPSGVDANVPGLSNRCVIGMTDEPVGPGACKSSPNYKNPEYFCYDKNSYFEAEVEMLQYRCPQPSNKK